ncbi:MAG: glycosyltransferase [Ardenticatenaceae bacterium]|nr:glycosyltransferase [Ardenticatenaceae bacterium]
MVNSLGVAHSCYKWLPLTENWIYRQIAYLPKGVETHVIAERRENADSFPWPHLHVLADHRLLYYADRAARRLGWRQHLQFVTTQVRKTGVQILHTHFGDRGWRNLAVAKKNHVKHIVTFYGYDVNLILQVDPNWYGRYTQLFAEVDLILCEGPYMRQSIINLGCPPQKVHTQHLGVETEKIIYQPRQWNPGQPLRVLMAASFIEKKGFPYGLQALGQIQKDYPIEITIIGDARHETRSIAEKEHIMTSIAQANLQKSVTFLGYQPYERLMKEAYTHHLFLSPSILASDGDSEGGAPVALIDMAATGIPIVSSFHCDIPAIIKHKETGRLAAERDVNDIAAQIRWWLEHPEAWDDLLANGRKHIEQEYNAVIQGQRLAQIYKDILA